MTHADVFWIAVEGGGKVGIVLRPRGGDWLHDEVAAWQSAGIDYVVSLLTPGEVREFGIEAEGDGCRRLGLSFVSFPFPDRGVPPSRRAAWDLARNLAREVRSGRNVVMHCRQGIGRSALMAALVLVASGVEPEQALRDVEWARGRPVPDTPEQRAWILAQEVPRAGAGLGVREPGERR